MKKLLLLFLLITPVFCDNLQRIQMLMPIPSVFTPFSLGIEPAIPEDFIAMSPDREELNLMDLYWGPREVLEAYFKDRSSLSQPIIKVTVGETTETEIKSQKCGEHILLSLPAVACERFQDCYLSWGNYPVYTLVTKFARFSKEPLLMAWVGLNNSSDMTLLFQLIFPSSEDHEPTASDLAFWNKFLRETKQLTGKSLMQAYGFDMGEGYTIVNQMKMKVTVVAERRKADQMQQLVIIPGEGELSFDVNELSHSTWEGRPAVLVKGVLTTEEDNQVLIHEHHFFVWIREVEDFFINEESGDNTPGLLVYRRRASEEEYLAHETL